MATLSELTVQIITTRLVKKEMSLDEMQKEMVAISNMIKAIDEGTAVEPVQESQTQEEPKQQKINLKKVFRGKEVICLLCNKSFRTLKRHLTQVHKISDKEYKAQFGIPASQPLAAKEYSDKKRDDAQKNKLGEKMQAGRKAKQDA